MNRFLKTCVAAMCLMAVSAAVAVAAPDKKSEKKAAPEKKMAMASCCMMDAKHDVYVSTCEVGNRGFFTQSECSMCGSTSPMLSVTHAAGKGCCPDHCAGNGAFFTKRKSHSCEATNAMGCCSASDTCCGKGDHKMAADAHKDHAGHDMHKDSKDMKKH